MKQKGQGIIEFAVIVPALVALGIAIVYMGIMFLDYTQYSNAARAAARDIALQTRAGEGSASTTLARKSIAAQRDAVVKLINDQDATLLSRYVVPYTDFYTAKWDAKFYKYTDQNNLDPSALTKVDSATNANLVQVTVTLSLAKDVEQGGRLGEWHVMPEELAPITYRMVLEQPTLINVNTTSN